MNWLIRYYFCGLILMIISISEPLMLHAQKTIELDEILKKKHELSISQLHLRSSYIKLQTDENCLIGQTRTLDIVNDHVIIAYDAIYGFDNQGQFKQILSHKGKGPGEYIEFGGMFPSVNKQGLFVHDRPNNELDHYDLSTGYTHTIKGADGFKSMVTSDNLMFNYFPLRFSLISKNSCVVIKDLEGKVLNRLKNRTDVNEKNVRNLTVRNSEMYLYHDTISIWDGYTNEIFRIGPDLKKSTKYVFDMGKKEMPVFIDGGPRNNNYRKLEARSLLVHKVLETSAFIFIECFDSNVYKCLVYDKQLEKGYSLFPSNRIYDHQNPDLGFWPNGVTSDGQLYEILLVSYLKSDRIDIDESTDLGKLIEISEDDDNPIIRLLH